MKNKSFIKVIILLTLTMYSNSFLLADDIERKSPYFVVISRDSTARLPLESTEVDVHISGVIADVNIKQTYTNTGDSTIEAIYVFPASTRAAVYAMKMQIEKRSINAVIQEKEEARETYETAKKEGKVTSLLEEEEANIFRMNVANITPGSTVEVDMSYTELLVPTNKVYEFVYPTVVGPRYVSQQETNNGTAKEWNKNPYLQEGEAPTSTLNIDLHVSAGMPIQAIACETHKNNVHFIDSSSVSLTLDEPEGGNRDFIVEYRLAGDKIESGILVYENPQDENFFIAMLQPPAHDDSVVMPPREYVFIVDVSGSMSGFPLDISKKAMQRILKNLNSNDLFNIVFFASDSKVYSTKSLPASKKNTAKAMDFMKSQSGGRGTELLTALETAMSLNVEENYSRSFVILTDGYVTVQRATFDYIRNNLGKANFFAFGIGRSVNRHLIEGMAHVGYGEPFIVTNENESDKQVDNFIKYISKPVLTDIDISFNNFDAYDIQPQNIPDLFAERPLIITGKYKGQAKGRLTIHGKSGNKEYNSNLRIRQLKANSESALKYLWAREKIKLLDDYAAVDRNDSTKKEVTNLGLKYNLLTRYTSFVAVDSIIVNEGGVNKSTKQALPLPSGVSNYAIGDALQGQISGLSMSAGSSSQNIVSSVAKIRMRTTSGYMIPNIDRTIGIGHSAQHISNLGLSGVYTQGITDEIPNYRSLPAINIPKNWLSYISWSNAKNSIDYGYEGIAGYKSFDLIKPTTKEKGEIDIVRKSTNSIEIGGNIIIPIKTNLSTTVMLNWKKDNVEHDLNKDGFMDFPITNSYGVLNKWKYKNNKYSSEYAIKILNETQKGGQTGMNDSLLVYSSNVKNSQYDFYTKQTYDKIQLKALGAYQDYNSSYAARTYTADLTKGFVDLAYNNEGSMHGYKLGISFIYDDYNEKYNNKDFNRTETVGGVYGQYEFSNNGLKTSAGVRVDYHNEFKGFITPNIGFKYQHYRFNIKSSLGLAYRSANVFAENSYLLASSRAFELQPQDFKQEKALNTNIEFTYKYKLTSRQRIGLYAQYGYVDFYDKTVVDLDSDPHTVSFYDLDGKSYAHSIQVNVDYTFTRYFSSELKYHFTDAKTTFNATLLDNPFVSRHRASALFSFKSSSWNSYININAFGKGRMPIPDVNNPLWNSHFDEYYTLDAMLSKDVHILLKRCKLSLKGENLTNYKISNPIISADNPLSQDFDATMIWGPVYGIKIMGGINITL